MGLLNFDRENIASDDSITDAAAVGDTLYHDGTDNHANDGIDYEDYVDLPPTVMEADDIINNEETHPVDPTPTPETNDDRLNNITDQLRDIGATIEEYRDIIGSQNETISDLHRQLEQRNDDSLTRPLFMQIIKYADRLQEILNHDDSMVEKGYDHFDRLSELRNDIEVLQQTIVSDLENHQIYQFRNTDENPLEYIHERQLLKDREESSNENEFIRYGDEVTTFYRSVAPGYLTIDDSQDDAVLRREEVVKVTFRP